MLTIISLALGAILLVAWRTSFSTDTSEPPTAIATSIVAATKEMTTVRPTLEPAATRTSQTDPSPEPSATLAPAPVPNPAPSPVPTRTFSGQRAFDLLVRQTEFGFRPTGSAAGWATGDWIIDTLATAGWETETQVFTYQGVPARNIVGKAPGAGEKPIIILGAHYDTRRRADQDPQNPDEPVLGANDAASGTAVLLELATSLDLGEIPYQVWLAFFDAEDNGHLDGWDWIVGSTYLASQLTIDPEFVIVVDMVGDSSQQLFYEGNSDPKLMAEIWSVAARLGFDDAFIPVYRHTILDDHIPFARLGIPAVDIIDFDYEYWHTTGDTVDKVSAQSLERVGRTLETFLETAETSRVIDE